MKNKEKPTLEVNSEYVLEVKELYKRYGKNNDFAVSDISFTAKKGEIIGLLGSNGAGKSTVLKCVTGMLPITKGEINITGYSIKEKPIMAKKNFAFVTDNHSVFVKMTGLQYLEFMADVYGVPSALRKETIDSLDQCFHLGDAVNKLISSYSHGMKQKICMMGSLIHNPTLWILDEPMVGLDPHTQKAVIEFMEGYVQKGNTILFSSHNLDVVKRICHRAVVIRKGKLVSDMNLRDKEQAEKLEEYYFEEDGKADA